ncbi:hypothetical protein [Mesorhizobium australicum]|uniref:hypothetical protein n=1 Tax=Mesorhizobium australicum TaxID=536018 RepID=UPI00333B4F3B
MLYTETTRFNHFGGTTAVFSGAKLDDAHFERLSAFEVRSEGESMSPENVVSDTDSANTDPGNEVTSTFIYDETDPDIVSRIEQKIVEGDRYTKSRVALVTSLAAADWSKAHLPPVLLFTFQNVRPNDNSHF